MVTIILTPFVFYSNVDEDLFFEWLKRTPCVKDFKGYGEELHVNSTKNIDFNDFINLNGIFKRYKFKNYGQLKKLFMNQTNERWFKYAQ